MWSGPIHDVEFVSKVLEHVDVNSANYGTSTRMKGMLTVAKEVNYYIPSSACSPPNYDRTGRNCKHHSSSLHLV